MSLRHFIGREKMLRKKVGTNQMSVAIQPKVFDASAMARRRKWRDIGGAYLFLTPNMLGFLVFILFPLVASFVISFFDWSLLTPPTFIGLGNYIRLLAQDPVFHRILFNTLYFVFGYVPLNIVVSLGLAVWLSGRIRGKSVFRVIFFFPVMTPAIAVSLVWLLMYGQVFILTSGGPGVSTTTLVLYMYQNGFAYFHMGYAATISTILFLLIMAVTISQFFFQRRWVHYEV